MRGIQKVLRLSVAEKEDRFRFLTSEEFARLSQSEKVAYLARAVNELGGREARQPHSSENALRGPTH